MQRFLKFVRRHPQDGPVEVLVQHFLADLDLQTPPIGAWQRDQIRQALAEFPGEGAWAGPGEGGNSASSRRLT